MCLSRSLSRHHFVRGVLTMDVKLQDVLQYIKHAGEVSEVILGQVEKAARKERLRLREERQAAHAVLNEMMERETSGRA